ncbi:MAG: PIG-L family deacetylase [Saprospiraceae bacterium]
MLNKKIYLFALICLQGFSANSQSKPSSVLLDEIKKLNVLGSVLYVAAHPDDENTRLITYLSKDKKYRTAYVSLTRGDGGQNLIGSQLDEYLGVIRTNELLEARKIDGGIQYFTRANDFGYSKNAEETFTIWNKDSLLFDLVRIIRDFQPDVIINRFDHRTSGKTHGHHTASAQLGLEAYKESSNVLYRREEMKDLEPIVIPRIFFNTSIFFYGSKEKFDAADKSSMYSLDLGSYYPSMGISNGEISAWSRSMHKSQGFGINSTRGKQLEYFERIDKIRESGQESPFDGLDLTWTRINGGGNVEKIINQVIQEYDINNPSASITLLQKAERYIDELRPGHWRDVKLKDIREIIIECAGIYAEAFTDQQIVSNGNKIKINTEFICRSKTNCLLDKIVFEPSKQDTLFSKTLVSNEPNIWSKEIELSGLKNTSPYWLEHGRGKSLYQVEDINLRKQAIAERTFTADFYIVLNGIKYTVKKEIIYKNDDPVKGEIRQNLDILPAVIVEPMDPTVLITDKNAVSIKLNIKALAAKQKGFIKLKLPEGLEASPSKIAYNLDKANEIQSIEFKIHSKVLNNFIYEVPVEINDQKAFTHTQIKYAHIPWQNVLVPTVLKVSTMNLKTEPKNIAYVNGAGDYIDEALRKLNYSVIELTPQEIKGLDPKITPVLIFGIRSWNTREELPLVRKSIMDYAERGGRVIFQYNTTSELMLGDFFGTDFKISRDRITNEDSPVRLLQPEHRLLNFPNKISPEDFNFWVQERGLYFPSGYSKDWEEILAMNDPNEKELNAAILYKKVGSGSIIYTPLSWFRELPAAVPGAYRLFVNLMSN